MPYGRKARQLEAFARFLERILGRRRVIHACVPETAIDREITWVRGQFAY